MGIRLNPGQDGELLASTEVAAGHFQHILAAYLDGSTPTIVDTSNKLPVDTGLSLAALATSAKQDTIITALASLATEATVATLGTESTLATRASESTLEALRALIDAVEHDGNSVPSSVNDRRRYFRVGISDSPVMDAFGRMRVSNPENKFDSSQVYEADPQFETVLTAGGLATHNPNRSAVQMTTTNSGDAVIRQSFEHISYEPGKSQLIFMTFVAYAHTTGCTKRIGAFDNNNGIFLESNGSEWRAVRRTEASGAPVDTAVAQASWNIDRMDGSGPSGVTIDVSKAQILVIDYEWLGVGRVRMGFVVDGLIHYFHEFLHANNLDQVWCLTGHLPVRYELTQSDVNPCQLDQICSTVLSEGGSPKIGRPRSYARSTALSAVDNTKWWPLISIRPKLTYNSLTNRLNALVQRISALGLTGNDQLIARLVWGCTLTGATFAVDPGTAYGCEVDIAATASTGGIQIAAFTAGAQVGDKLDNLKDIIVPKIALNQAGGHPTSPYTDVYSLQVRCPNATADVVGSIDWLERGQ